MNYIWNESLDAVLAIGRPLEPLGVRNFALSKASALEALEQLKLLGIAVLGGDVYVDQEGELQNNCDNWYCDPLEGEDNTAFVSRSVALARNYIQSYSFDSAYFALVPGPHKQTEKSPI